MLTRLKLQNFRSYEAAELVFGDRKLNIVIGDSSSDYSDSNGSGKSTLMYAVCWGLYGKWPGMDRVDSAVHRPRGKDCCVELEIILRGVAHTVKRTREHKEFGNSLWVNGKTGDLPAMQTFLETILGMGYETFVATMVFTGHPDTAFSAMTDGEQKRILQALLPVDMGAASVRSASLLKTAAQNRTSAEVRLQEQKAGMVQIQARIAEKKAVLEAAEKREQESALRHSQAVDSCRQAVERLLEQRIDLRNQVAEARKQMEVIEAGSPQWEGAAKQWEALRAASIEYERKRTMLEAARTGHERQLAEATRNIQAAKAKLDGLSGAPGSSRVCPTCGSVLSDPRKIEAHYAEEYNKAVAVYADKEQQGTRQVQELLQALQALKIPENYESQYAAFRSQYEQFSKQRNTAKEGHASTLLKLSQLEVQTKSAELALAQAEKAPSSGRDEIISLKAVIEDASQNLAHASTAVVQAENNVAACVREERIAGNVALLFSSGKGSLQHFIFEAALPELSATAQMFLRFLSDEQLTVGVRSHRTVGKKTVEGFFVEAGKTGCTDAYGDLSGGEKRRIDLALFLALYLVASRNILPLGILFLDEIADPLDETGQQKVVQMLQHVCTEYGLNCLLLTNVKELVASVPDGYRCSIESGVSRLTRFNES